MKLTTIGCISGFRFLKLLTGKSFSIFRRWCETLKCTPTILIAFSFFIQQANSQFCIPNRFDSTYFDMSQIDSVMNTKYGEAYNWQDTAIQTLKMDVYFPKSSIDPLAKRPLIVMIHAGGFYLGSKNHYKYYCREFAKRGFVAATIDYRIGWDFGLGEHYDTLPLPLQIGYPFECLGDSISSIKALGAEAICPPPFIRQSGYSS